MFLALRKGSVDLSHGNQRFLIENVGIGDFPKQKWTFACVIVAIYGAMSNIWRQAITFLLWKQGIQNSFGRFRGKSIDGKAIY